MAKELKRKRLRRQLRSDADTKSNGICTLGAFGRSRWTEGEPRRKKGFLFPWKRDGYESRTHYLADGRLRSRFIDVLKHGMTGDEYFTLATAARTLGLL